MEHQDTLDQMKDKVHELAGSEFFFSRRLLNENGLLNEAIIEYIYYEDFLDAITVQEAIGAMPSLAKKFRYNRKIALKERSPLMAKIRWGVYNLREILDNVYQYMIILRQRDEYMPIKNAAANLNITEVLMRERTANKNVPALYGKFIRIEDIEATKPITTRKPPQMILLNKASKQLGVSRWTLWRHKKKEGQNCKRGALTEKELIEMRQHIKVPNHEVMENLKIKKQQFERITKGLGIKTQGGYTSIADIKKIGQAVNHEKTCTIQ